MLGLTNAARAYDPQKNVKFYSFAKRVIENQMRKELIQGRPRGFRKPRDAGSSSPPKIQTLGPGAERYGVRPRGEPSPDPEPDHVEAFELLLLRFRAGVRPLLRLVFQEGLSIPEVARILGLTRREAFDCYSQALAEVDVPQRPTRPQQVVIYATRLRRRREAASCHPF